VVVHNTGKQALAVGRCPVLDCHGLRFLEPVRIYG